MLVIFGWLRRFTILGIKFDECDSCGQVGPIRHGTRSTTDRRGLAPPSGTSLGPNVSEQPVAHDRDEQYGLGHIEQLKQFVNRPPGFHGFTEPR